MSLHVIFDGGKSADDVMEMEVDRLVVDDEYIPMKDKRVRRIKDYAMINAVYQLDDELLEKIGRAKHVGMMFQWREDAAIFMGFDLMPFEEGAKKLPGLLAVYRRQ